MQAMASMNTGVNSNSVGCRDVINSADTRLLQAPVQSLNERAHQPETNVATACTTDVNVNTNVNNSSHVPTVSWAASHVSSIETSSCGELGESEGGSGWHKVKRHKRYRASSDSPNDHNNQIARSTDRQNHGAESCSLTPDKHRKGNSAVSYADKAKSSDN